MKNRKVTNIQAGFTLVELSIVLVIIGLIVGGVLQGQDLIKAARVRAQISQITQYNTATNTFHEKYGGLPGDLLSGANYFSGITNQNSTSAGWGNGDGIVQYATTFQALQGEIEIFWYELNQSGLIPDPTNGSNGDYNYSVSSYTNFNSSNLPLGKIPSTYVMIVPGETGTSAQNNDFWLLENPAAGLVAISVLTASQIDGKIDDGFPNTGNVLSIASQNAGVPGDAGIVPGSATGCTANTSFSAYNVATASNSVNCSISIAVSF